MTTIYVVTGESGEWSDHSKWNVCWCASEDEAKTIVDKLNESSGPARYNRPDYSYEELTDDAADEIKRLEAWR